MMKSEPKQQISPALRALQYNFQNVLLAYWTILYETKWKCPSQLKAAN